MKRDFDFCPACGKKLPDHVGALSRRDNTTEICSECGVVEAFQMLVCPAVLKGTKKKKKGSGKP